MNTVAREVTAEKQAEELRRSHEEVQDLSGRPIAVQEAERARIARELHGDINQRLAALAIAVSGLRRRLTGGLGRISLDERVRLAGGVFGSTAGRAGERRCGCEYHVGGRTG